MEDNNKPTYEASPLFDHLPNLTHQLHGPLAQKLRYFHPPDKFQDLSTQHKELNNILLQFQNLVDATTKKVKVDEFMNMVSSNIIKQLNKAAK